MSRWKRLAAVMAIGATGLMVAGTPANAVTPQPVSDLHVTPRDGYLLVTWTASPDTPWSVVCNERGTAPATSPADPMAVCANAGTTGGYGWTQLFVTGSSTYTVTVFSRDPVSGAAGAPVSASADAFDDPPGTPYVSTEPLSLSALRVRVTLSVDTEADWTDAWDVLVSWAAGVAVPPPTEPGHVARVLPTTDGEGWFAQVDVTGLSRGVVYTIGARVRDRSGNIGGPGSIHAMTRSPGLSVLKSGAVSRLAIRVQGNASAAMRTPGVFEAAFAAADAGVVEAHLGSTGRWTTHRIGGYALTDPMLATGPGGFVVIAGGDDHGTYYAYRSSGRWSAAKRLTTHAWDAVEGVTSDSAGRIHLLVYVEGRIWYITNGSGRWTRYELASSVTGGLLTRDPVTDRMVLLIRRYIASTHVIRDSVSVFSARATRPGRLATWWSSQDPAAGGTSGSYWWATSLASYGGKIAVGVQRTNPAAGQEGTDGPFVIAGTATTHGRLTRVPHTGRSDSHLVVTAPSTTRQVLTWQRGSTTWDLASVGVWTSERVYHPATHATTYTAPRHWSSSPYDSSVAAFRDARGVLRVVIASHAQVTW